MAFEPRTAGWAHPGEKAVAHQMPTRRHARGVGGLWALSPEGDHPLGFSATPCGAQTPGCSWSPVSKGRVSKPQAASDKGHGQPVGRAKQLRRGTCQAVDPGDALKGLLLCKRGGVFFGESLHPRPTPCPFQSPLGLCSHASCFLASELLYLVTTTTLTRRKQGTMARGEPAGLQRGATPLQTVTTDVCLQQN